MEKEFGKIKRGNEDMYTMVLFTMESNALKVHRKFPASNSRKMREAIALVLYDLKQNYTGEAFDASAFRNDDNERLETALLMAFDPCTNPEVLESLKEKLQVEEMTPEILKDYYKIPIMCLLRIKESVDMFEKHRDSNGYFNYIESSLGKHVKDDEMKYAIMY